MSKYLLIFLLFSFTSCGVKGPLYLPTKETTVTKE
ncbi:MAG: lipoprotein [Sphingobacteriia bacterium]|nr:lipoprotein [Sphingobacteriia bacterium]